MAQSERFYFWRGYYDALLKLPDPEQRDALVMGICAYAFDGEEPDFSEAPFLDIVWQIIRDQVHESVAIGREMSERGRRGGKASGKARSTGSSTGSSSASSEGKGTDRKGSEPSPSGKGGSAPAPDGAARRPGETEQERIVRIYGPQPDLPPKPDGWE